MSTLKKYKSQNVLDAARERIAYAFDAFERVYGFVEQKLITKINEAKSEISE